MINHVDRKKKIVDLLLTKGAITYEELASVFNMSAMTIRRDVEQLAKDGKVLKVLGGVQIANAPDNYYETQLTQRFRQNREAKIAIAEKAVESIQSRDTIFLDGSTTCLELAKILARCGKGTTVVTNSILVCQKLGVNNTLRILTMGGQYDPDSFSFAGELSEQQIDQYYFDKAFMSTRGFIPSEGTFESNIGTFRLKQLIARNSNEVVLLVDSSKFGKRALSKVLNMSDINRVITNDDVSESDISSIKNGGCVVDVVSMKSVMAK